MIVAADGVGTVVVVVVAVVVVAVVADGVGVVTVVAAVAVVVVAVVAVVVAADGVGVVTVVAAVAVVAVVVAADGVVVVVVVAAADVVTVAQTHFHSRALLINRKRTTNTGVLNTKERNIIKRRLRMTKKHKISYRNHNESSTRALEMTSSNCVQLEGL